MPTTAPVAIASRHASSSSFSVNGSPTWTVGRFASASSSKVADAIGAPAKDAVGAHESNAHDVHQRVAGVLRREGDLAADGGTTETVAIPRDAGDDPVDQAPRLRVRRVSESQ